MPTEIPVTLAGHAFRLLAKRAVYYAAQQTLFVADPHLGKEATFRKHGIPVPRGSTDGTLSIIVQLLQQTQAKRLMILGDMFHARSSLSADVSQSLNDFFERNGDVQMSLVLGNHDASFGDLLLPWPIEIVPAGYRMDRIAVGHHPMAVPPEADVYFCGHLHPAIQLTLGRQSLGRAACFWYSRGCLVLPAIGQFTGTQVIRPAAADQTWFVAEDEIHPGF